MDESNRSSMEANWVIERRKKFENCGAWLINVKNFMDINNFSGKAEDKDKIHNHNSNSSNEIYNHNSNYNKIDDHDDDNNKIDNHYQYNTIFLFQSISLWPLLRSWCWCGGFKGRCWNKTCRHQTYHKVKEEEEKGIVSVIFHLLLFLSLFILSFSFTSVFLIF